MRHDSAKQMALGGVLAALAVVIMCLGGFLYVATFVCPVLCAMLLKVIYRLCGRRVAWAWYGAVAFLCALLGPDKEAAAVFVFFGYYPIVKPWFDRRKLSWLWKTVFFNGLTIAMYSLLILLLGMDEIATEFRDMGTVLFLITLALGNLLFWMLDRVLARNFRLRKR